MAYPYTLGDYRRPQGQRIDRWEETEKLYKLEAHRQKAIEAAAIELGVLLQKFGQIEDAKKGFWKEVLPEALLAILNSWDSDAARLAAEVFIEIDDRNRARYAKAEPSEDSGRYVDLAEHMETVAIEEGFQREEGY